MFLTSIQTCRQMLVEHARWHWHITQAFASPEQLINPCSYSHFLSNCNAAFCITNPLFFRYACQSSSITCSFARHQTYILYVCLCVKSQTCTQVAERRQTAAPPGAAAASATPSSQQQVTLPDLSFSAPAPSNLEQAYQEAMEPLTVSDFDSSLPGAYNR